MSNAAQFIKQQIEQYEIREHIGRGGMADVYLAYDVDLQRPAALKIMRPTLAADRKFVTRFRREAQTVARLEHPNIVQVYGIGMTVTDQPYIAMQFIEGGDLYGVMRQAYEQKMLLSPIEVLYIAHPMADALRVAHMASVIHRDLKPSNILMRRDGTPVMVDLGIASIQGKSRLTHTGTLIGTPHYMAPEQARGVSVDSRADVYSLGIILYELLAGKLPFEAEDTMGVLYKHVHEEPPPLQQFRDDLTPETILLIQACLQKVPGQRPSTTTNLLHLIESALAVEEARGAVLPTRPMPIAAPTPMRPPSRGSNGFGTDRTEVLPAPAGMLSLKRRKWWVALAGAGLLALILFGLFSLPNYPLIGDSATETAVPQTSGAGLAVLDTAVPTATASATEPPTATPSPTLTPTTRPTLAPGQIGFYYANEQSFQLFSGDDIRTGTEVYEIQINHTDEILEPGNIYAWPDTRLQFRDVDADTMELVLFEPGDIFVEAGRYAGGVEVILAQNPAVRFVTNGCMTLSYPEPEDADIIAAGCYDGACSYLTGFDVAPTPIESGNQLLFDTNELAAIEMSQILPAEAGRYQTVLSLFGTGQVVLNRCVDQYIPDQTPVSVTPTPTDSSTSGGSGSNTPPTPAPITNTPVPATATRPAITPTNTPVPPTATPTSSNDEVPTNTPVPPTATQTPEEKPTDTPIPATNTPIPPTATSSPDDEKPTNTPGPISTAISPSPTSCSEKCE